MRGKKRSIKDRERKITMKTRTKWEKGGKKGESRKANKLDYEIKAIKKIEKNIEVIL